jgi:CRP/FNR family transcriptional regulator, nitrogen oxide reductase regulator
MTADTKQGVDRVLPRDHVVFIYENAAELTAFAVPFVKEGLARGERCLYVVDDPERTQITEALVAGGVDVTQEHERGAFVLMNAEQFAGPPPFDPVRLIELIRRRMTEAGSRGFTGLRIAGQMTWTIEARVSDRALVEFELLLEKAGSGPLTVACMYRRDRFNRAVLQQMIRSHPIVIADDSVYLSLSPLFQGLTPADLQGLARSSRERRIPKGGFYFHQGDPVRAPEVCMLTYGMVKLVRTDSDGHSVILRIVEPMGLFGDPLSMGSPTRLASAQALEDSRALIWDGRTILPAITTHPAVSLNAVRLFEERLEEERSRLHDLATSDVERRLARLLLRLAQSIGRRTVRGLAIDVSLSGQDLAELAVATPYTVSRILADWRRLSIADAQRDRILLLDPERVAAVAQMRVGGETPQDWVGEPL